MLRPLLPLLTLTLAVGALLAPLRASACIYPLARPWTKRSDDQRFELTLSLVKKKSDHDRSPGAELALRDLRTRQVLWKHPLPSLVYEFQARFSPSGRYIAVVRDFSETVSLFSTSGTESGQWKLGQHLSEVERQRVPSTTCGLHWVSDVRFDGDALVLTVPQDGGGSRVVALLPDGGEPPWDAHPPPLHLRIDPAKQTLTRGP